MAATRDWARTLWSASYKGFPFFFDTDDEEGGLGLVIHKFPNRDDPFIEDLGEEPRFFSGTAYLSGDDVDARTAGFLGVLASHGPGILVVPIRGPILVRCQTFKRSSELDKLGYVAFELKFVREGASSALISVAQAGRLAFIAADGLAAALAAAFPAGLKVSGQPLFVAQAASDAIVAAAAALDAVRTSAPVDPVVSATARNQIAAIVAAAPLLLGPDAADPNDVANLVSAASLASSLTDGPTVIAAATVATVRGLAAGMDPSAALDAALSLAAAFAPPTPIAFLAASSASVFANERAVAQMARLAALTAFGEALVRRTYTDRPQGVTARAMAAERFELELNLCPGADYVSLYLAIKALQGRVVQYLTQLINDLAPVITVSAAISMPSLYWAWRLYQDPTRCVDLTLRNQVRHPSFLPRDFAALAPGFAAPNLPTAWPAPPL